MQKQQNFTEGKILGPLIRFALPVLLAIFLQTMYGAVDLLVVGQFGTAADVSAVSTGSQIMQSITAVINGLAMGVTILLGRKIGEGRSNEAGGVIGASICLFATLGLVISVVMQPLAAPSATLMQAPAAAFQGTVDYVRICCGGAVFIVAYNVLGGVFRGIGNSTLPLVTVAISCVLNIVGDLLLVAVCGMGVAGAAIATVFAQAVSVALSVLLIKRQGLPFAFARKDMRFDRALIGRIVKLGLPIALQDLLVSLSFLAILAIVNGMGVVISAGVGVAEKICGFIMLVPSAYMQSMSAFVAQNIGARKPERARKALFYGIATSLAVGIVIGYFSFFHGNLLAGIFSKDAEVVAAGWQYLRAYAIDCLLTSFLFCFVGYFNGCGRTKLVMVQGIVGSFGVRVPVSFLMSRIVPQSVFLVGLATPCSTLVQIAICGVAFALAAKKERRQLA